MKMTKRTVLGLLALLASSTEAQEGNDHSNSTNATSSASSLEMSLPAPPAPTVLSVFNTRNIPFPDYRFRPWNTLDDTEKANAELLGYDEDSWNSPGNNLIELSAYETIEAVALEIAVTKQEATLKEQDKTTAKSDEKNDKDKNNDKDKDKSDATEPPALTQFEALFALGFNDWEVYDCYINHYGDYWWEELEVAVQKAWEAIGWGEAQWNGQAPAPETDNKSWHELTLEEKRGAAELCYLPEIWQGANLEYWQVDYANLAPDSTLQDLMDYTASTGEASKEVQPYAFIDHFLTSYKPVNRFYAWESLPQEITKVAESIGYTEDNWVNITIDAASIELIAYDDLDEKQLTAIGNLGFGPKEVYDCWIHHYDSYDWGELGETGVRDYWVALGWTIRSWQGIIAPPASSDKMFVEMSEEEQHAAQQVCYCAEVWNSDFLTTPEDDVEITLAPEEAQTPLPTPAPTTPVPVHTVHTHITTTHTVSFIGENETFSESSESVEEEEVEEDESEDTPPKLTAFGTRAPKDAFASAGAQSVESAAGTVSSGAWSLGIILVSALMVLV